MYRDDRTEAEAERRQDELEERLDEQARAMRWLVRLLWFVAAVVAVKLGGGC